MRLCSRARRCGGRALRGWRPGGGWRAQWERAARLWDGGVGVGVLDGGQALGIEVGCRQPGRGAGRHRAFAALTTSPGAHAHYNRRRETGDRYYPALRHLFNRMIGQLHHCLTTRQKFDETTTFTPPARPQLSTAA